MDFADVKNDIAFRKIFGNEHKKEILISFINAVLRLDDTNCIVDLEILNPYQPPRIAGLKGSIIDIKARDLNNNFYIVEMQVANKKGFDKRVLYYTSKEYASQLNEKQQYFKLHPIIFIGILNYEYLRGTHYISKHAIIDLETHERKITDLEFHFIELPKFHKTEAELDSILDKWLYFIKNAENLTLIPQNTDNEALKEAYEEADKHLWSKIELADYEDFLMREADEEARELYLAEKAEIIKKQSEEAEKKSEEAEKKSEEAEKKSEEAEKKIRALVKMLKEDGFSIEKIVKMTGLTIEEIEEL